MILAVPFSVVFLQIDLVEVNRYSISYGFFFSFSVLIITCFSTMNLLYK